MIHTPQFVVSWTRQLAPLWIVLMVIACGDPQETTEVNEDSDGPTDASIDITDVTFTNRSPLCSSYVGNYRASVTDLDRMKSFTSTLTIQVSGDTCSFTSNSIPNHNFNDRGEFATPLSEVNERFTLTATPAQATSSTALSLRISRGEARQILPTRCTGGRPEVNLDWVPAKCQAGRWAGVRAFGELLAAETVLISPLLHKAKIAISTTVG